MLRYQNKGKRKRIEKLYDSELEIKQRWIWSKKSCNKWNVWNKEITWQKVREINAELKEKDIELEIVNEENVDLQEKLDTMTQELKDLKWKFDKEREDNMKKKNQKERRVVQYDTKNMKKIGKFMYG